ncbi:hypothetical protein LCI18_004242 [Fusarium solani-melongenae]|uniref:Uncharacterized protein n=1 Tax=Fusarium solani subsp. cucurbitae TaxID=2747967 RepID=A0ACD3YWQ7_FUSSC|nr:hypothetical protein LCI18_004242 [Fusarium solani-melongenae]
MYGPAAPRSRKTNITRTRSGCLPCRQRRRKCDEQKPSCHRCARRGATCEYGDTFEFRNVNGWVARKVVKVKQPVPSSGPSVVPEPPPQQDPETRSLPDTALQTPQDTLADNIARDSPQSAHDRATGEPDRFRPYEKSPEWDSDTPELVSGCSTLPHAILAPCPPSNNDTPDVTESGTSNGIIYPRGMFHDIWDPGSAWDVTEAYCPEALSILPTCVGATIGIQWPSELDYCQPNTLETESPPHNQLTPMSEALVDVAGLGQSLLDCLESVVSPRTDRTSMSSPLNQLQQSSLHNLSSAQSSHPPRLSRLPAGDRIYLAHFMVHVVDVLPGPFDSLKQAVLAAEPVRLAAMAVAAGSLASVEGRFEARQGCKGAIWVPKWSRLVDAQKYASEALSTVGEDTSVSLCATVAVGILLSYYQMETGTIGDFRRQISSLESMIVANQDALLLQPLGLNFLRAALHLRAFNLAMRAPFRPSGAESRTDLLFADLERLMAVPSELITLIGTKAFLISSRVLLYRCTRIRGISNEEMLRKAHQWWSIMQDVPFLDDDQGRPPGECYEAVLTEDELYEELRSLGRQLQACGATLETPEIIEALEADSQGDMWLGPESTEPLRFETHNQAMACANYALAQIFCDEALLRQLAEPASAVPSPPLPASNSRAASWLRLLFRVAAGLDPSECVRRNKYRRGIAQALYLSTFRCGDKSVLLSVDNFLEKLGATGVSFEDTTMPVRMSQLMNRAVWRQVARGRVVFLVGSTHSLDADRDTIYATDTDEHLILQGKEADGSYFSDCVPICEEGEAIIEE